MSIDDEKNDENTAPEEKLNDFNNIDMADDGALNAAPDETIGSLNPLPMNPEPLMHEHYINEKEEEPKEEEPKKEEPKKEEPKKEEPKKEEPKKDTIEADDTTGKYYNETVKKKKGRNGSFKRFIAACLVISIAGGGSMGVGYGIVRNTIDNKQGSEDEGHESMPQSPFVTTATDNNTAKYQNTAVNVIKSVYSSVVSITTKTQQTASYFGGYSIPFEGKSAGSGVIFFEDDNKVYVATNAHVIDSATEIAIAFDKAENTIPSKIVGTDTTADLAVLSVLKSDLKAQGIDDVTIAVFGDSGKLELGENVIAIGNALGEGKTTTGGMVSAADKKIIIDGRELQVIQTDAAINPGNSGGALINYNGEVVGINTAKSFESAVEGMGYAIPCNVAIPIVERLLTDGTAAKPYLGIAGQDITDDISQLYRLPVGVLVRQVVEDGSAGKAGLKEGDIITGLAGKPVMTMNGLVDILAKTKVGDTVNMSIIRDGNTAMDLKVVIQDANAES